MKVFLITLLTANISLAATPVPDSEVWSAGKVHYVFNKSESKILLTEKCWSKKFKCEAYRATQNKNKTVLTEADRAGGKNPGAVVCKKHYNGEVLILRDTQNNENAFCKFKDNSVTSTSDIY